MEQDREHESGAVWRYGDGWAFDVRPPHFRSALDELDGDQEQQVYDRVQELWWEMVKDEARDLGFSGVWSAGRMGGWLVPHVDGRELGGYLEGWSDDELIAGPYYTGVGFAAEWSGVPVLDDERSAMLCALGEVVRSALQPETLAGLVAYVVECIEDEQEEAEAARRRKVGALVSQLVAADGDAEQVAALVGPLVR
jgi:hypothetical protein